MPSRISRSPSSRSSKERTGIIKFTNCLLAKDGKLVPEDLWISSITGKVLQSQEVFYNNRASPDRIIDLGGRVLSPGFIDVQINGGFGFDFSVEQESITEYAKGVMKVNRGLVKTGVTSYLPTVTSQRAELYPKIIPYLGPSGARRDPNDGAESLGAHIEGPFISPTKNGIHSVSVLRTAENGFADMEACYGASNLQPHASPIKMLTLAPELPNALSNIHELTSRGIVTSIGHSEATYEQARDAISAGATMITHLFNAMRPLHHRNPGIFGTLGTATATAAATPSTPAVTPPGSPVSAVRFKKPYFGLISDGVHLHPTSIKIAWNAHRDGAILVTDAMRLLGLPDGTYDWTNGDRIIKKGLLLTLEGTDGKLAGTSVSLVECVSNFINWADATVGEALRTVTATPAKMLGLQGVKGSLEPGADADLVVLEEGLDTNGMKKLTVEEVWKFGKMVYSTDDVIEEEEE